MVDAGPDREPSRPEAMESPAAESPAASQMIRDAVVLQLKLILEGIKDLLLGPIALLGLLIDLLVRRPGDRHLFYRVLEGGQRFEEFLDLYGSLRQREAARRDAQRTGPTLDKVLDWSERRVRTYVADRKERRGGGPPEPPSV